MSIVSTARQNIFKKNVNNGGFKRFGFLNVYFSSKKVYTYCIISGIISKKNQKFNDFPTF